MNPRSRWFGAALIVAAAAVTLSACSTGSTTTGGGGVVTQTVTQSVPPPATSASTGVSTSSAPTCAKTTKVHLSSLENDGTTWGVGMPIIIYATPHPANTIEFNKGVTVTVDGQPADGAWNWSQPNSDEKKTNTFEAHYRLRNANYWPAHADIEVNLDLANKSAGDCLVYDGKLSSISIGTGDANISYVDAGSKTMVVTKNGKQVKTIEVSLGAAQTPTYNGVKVVMQKGEALDPATDPEKLRPSGAVRMVGDGYDEIVNWSVRVTNSGEYIHAAPWNSHIGQLSTSNGCTNLTTADAKWFYNFSQVGDVVEYKNTDGGKMPSWDGYGDWNVPWQQWSQGGKLINRYDTTGSSGSASAPGSSSSSETPTDSAASS
ncbi:MAG TPA: L,D-transpeptidase [Jatrophihabitans sp.]